MSQALQLAEYGSRGVGLAFKNRIINGAMTIDQRNAGASVTINGNAPYVLDRYFAQDDTDGSFTVQQSSVVPSDFTNSMLITVASTDTSLGATQLARVTQRIEGFNVADLNWGTANAKTVTLSFWVRSSVTGTFGGSVVNGAGNRSYPFTYAISSANTYEYKTITIAGDTSGTWLTNNGIGLELNFTLAAGSTYSGTAGSWSGSLLFSATGATNLLATNGATFYITGVQLEVGTTATSFDYRPYGTELQLCQRYFYKTYNTNTAVGTATGEGAFVGIANGAGSRPIVNLFFPVTMRANPTSTVYSQATGTAGKVRNIDAGVDYDGLVLFSTMTNMCWYPNATPPNSNAITAQVTSSAEL